MTGVQDSPQTLELHDVEELIDFARHSASTTTGFGHLDTDLSLIHI